MSAFTARRPAETAALVCTRCAEDRAVTASERLPIPAASWAAARSAAERAARYCDCETDSADSACLRAARSGIRRAAVRARAKAADACASAAAAPASETGAPPDRPASAARASARSAWRSRRRVSGDSTRRSSCPCLTCWPSRTRSSPTVPSAVEAMAALARAVTVAGASTTSVTVARSTPATWTALPSSPLHAETASTATRTSAAAREITASS